MNTHRILFFSAIAGLFFASTTMGAGLTDQYDPFVTADEISATPSMPDSAREQLVDLYDPYVFSHEIVVSEGCINPANKLVADQYQPFVTVAELEAAESKSTC